MSDLPPLAYCRPATLTAALAELARPGAWAYAGGTDLLVALSERRPWVRSVRVLVDIKAVPEASGITESATHLRIGALTTARQLAASTVVRRSARALAEAALQTSSPLLRARGTLGGNLMTPHPAGDIATALLALGASVEITADGVARAVSVADCLAARPGRDAFPFLILAVTIRKCAHSAFIKVSTRHGFGRSIVAAAVALRGRTRAIALGGIAARPLLVSARRNQDTLAGVARVGAIDRASLESRLDLARVLVARAERQAAAR